MITSQAMTDARPSLLSLLDLENLDVNLFRGASPETDRQRIFGGAVAGQALVAAVRTIGEDRRVHSLHSYFLRPGDSALPIIYTVDPIRDGRSFSTRRVVASQRGTPIFHLSASFHVDESGPTHADEMPSTPAPEDLPSDAERAEGQGQRWTPPFEAWAAIERRYVRPPPDVARRRDRDLQMWLRMVEPMPAQTHLHACVLTYMSDMALLMTAILPHGMTFGRANPYMMASLDHAVWFHRPFRADDWLLYDMRSPTAQGARGLGIGRVFTRDGALVATVVQEGLTRPRRDG